MDFGGSCLDEVVSLASSSSSSSSDLQTKQSLLRSSCSNSNCSKYVQKDDCCRNPKFARTEDRDERKRSDSSCTSMLLKSNGPCLFSDFYRHPHRKMLNFSCPTKPETQSVSFHEFPFSSYPYNARNTEGWNKGPFTGAQRRELEQQTSMYNFISSCIPSPPLFTPASSWGSGPFHLGSSSSSDPEPGRCRRTDGKKWRCSREAVQDHKYCERHINRGRHRSRKPVEGHRQQQQNLTHPSASNTTTTCSALATPIINLSSAATPMINHVFMSEGRADNLHCRESLFSINSRQRSTFEQSLQNQFLNFSSESLFDHSSPSNPNCCTNLSIRETKSRNHPPVLFVDSWTRNQSDQTQFLDFMSSTSSTGNDCFRLSTLRPSNNRQANWVPISVGGPLGEALHNRSAEDNPSESSPTGVLQKTTFGSLSNSSTGSSPTSKIQEGVCFCSSDIGSSALIHSTGLPP